MKASISKDSAIRSMVSGYMEALLWSSTIVLDEAGEDCVWADEYPASCELVQKSHLEVNEFFDANMVNLIDYVHRIDMDTLEHAWNNAGHDFALTRNGLGTGFWDRGLGGLGEDIADTARSYGSVDLYLGDDGLLYS